MATTTTPAGKTPRVSSALVKDLLKDETSPMEVENTFECGSTGNQPPLGCTTGALTPIEDRMTSKKRSRPNFFDDGKSHHCILLTGFNNEQKDMVLDSIVEWMAEQQGDMSSDDELPDEDMDVEEIEIARVRILLSEEQRKANKTAYREGYVKREEVIQKRKAKENDPEQKKKREAYSKDPVVRQRKSTRTKVRQGINRSLKKTNPTLYKQLEKQAEEEVKKRILAEAQGSVAEPPQKRQKLDESQVIDVEK